MKDIMDKKLNEDDRLSLILDYLYGENQHDFEIIRKLILDDDYIVSLEAIDFVISKRCTKNYIKEFKSIIENDKEPYKVARSVLAICLSDPRSINVKKYHDSLYGMWIDLANYIKHRDIFSLLRLFSYSLSSDESEKSLSLNLISDFHEFIDKNDHKKIIRLISRLK